MKDRKPWPYKTRMRETYGVALPGMDLSNLSGKLIVIEGTERRGPHHADGPAEAVAFGKRATGGAAMISLAIFPN